MSSLSPEDVAVLRSIGHDTVQNIVAVVVDAVLHTIYFMCVVITGRILLRKGRSMISVTIFAIILTMHLLEMSMVIIDINNAIRKITMTLLPTTPTSLAERYAATNSLPYSVENALYAYMLNLGDIVIIWRAWAFWSNGKERWVMIVPCTLLLGSLVTSSLVSFCVAQIVQEPEAGQFLNPPFCRNIQHTLFSMTAATTAVTTFLIFYKTWLYRRDIGSILNSATNKTRAEKVMVILIESGLLYFLFSLEFVIADSGNIPSLERKTLELAFARTIWTYTTSKIIGIYPTLIIILVHSQKSCLEETMVSTHLRSSTHFAPSSSGSRGVWPASRKRQNDAHTIEINVHEMRDMESSRGGETASVAGAESTADELVKGNGAEKSFVSISALNEPV